MKAQEKLTVIEAQNGKITIYSMIPDLKKIEQFRKEQHSGIDNIFYLAIANKKNEENYSDPELIRQYNYLDERRLRRQTDDTFPADVLGYSRETLPLEDSFIPVSHGDSIPIKVYPRAVTHNFFPIDIEQTGGLVKSNLKSFLKDYYSGKGNSIPFRVMISEHDYMNFLPTSESYEFGTHMDSLLLSDLAYLEQLLLCNRVDLFLKRCEELGVDPIVILKLYIFKKEKEIDLEAFKKEEKEHRAVSDLLYGPKSTDLFLKTIPTDESRTEELRKPISSDLLEQAEIDKPIIERVKALVLER